MKRIPRYCQKCGARMGRFIDYTRYDPQTGLPLSEWMWACSFDHEDWQMPFGSTHAGKSIKESGARFNLSLRLWKKGKL